MRLNNREQFYIDFSPTDSQKQTIFFTLNVKVKNDYEMYNGFLELSQIFSNGEEVMISVPLARSAGKTPNKTYLTVGVLPYTCSIFKELSSNCTACLTLELRYAVELTKLPEGVLRQTASYLLRATFNNKQHYFLASMQTERINDIGPTQLYAGDARK